ncbi:hypothetical protein CDAR_94051 [Caerostris darwini]|uniref:Uncharacterized protein n=1 Tax=Caerostris darwini TaxID=1538125 RepID=A0AAV4NN03_9ARAC|nr:hypothetical protein CDAR_94051 [Caerostris darwini]
MGEQAALTVDSVDTPKQWRLSAYAFFEQGWGEGLRLIDGMRVDSAITEAATCRRLVKQSDCFLNAPQAKRQMRVSVSCNNFLQIRPPAGQAFH